MIWIESIAVIVMLFVVWFAGRARQFPTAGLIFIFGFFVYVYAGALIASTDLVAADMSPEPFYRTLNLIRLTFWTAGILFVAVTQILPLALSQRVSTTDRMDDYQLASLHFVALICVAANLGYVAAIPGNPWSAVFGDQTQLAYLREQATTTFRWFPLFSLWISFITPFILLVYWFARFDRFAIGLLILNTATLLITGQKAPLVFALLSITIAIGLRNRQFPYGKAATAGMFGAGGLLAIVLLQNFDLTRLGFEWEYLGLAWDAIFRRVVMIGAWVTYGYVDYFPFRMDHYFLSPPAIPPDQLVFKHLYPGVDIEGTANAAFIATVYSAFGEIPVLLWTIIVAVIGTFFFGERVLLANANTPSKLALYTIVCLIALRMCITDLSTAISPVIFFVGTARGTMYVFEACYRWLDNGTFGVRGSTPVVLVCLMVTGYVVQGWVRNLL